MGSPYQSQSASNYNSSPPPDDGTTVAANKITWAKIKSALADSVKTLADAINTQLRTTLNVSPTTTSVNYTTLVSDHLTAIEVTGTTTITLGDAATMIAQSMGYTVTVYNKGTNTVTVNLATNTNKLNGQTNGSMTLPPQAAATYTVAQSGTDYETVATSNPQTLLPPRGYLAGLTLSTAGSSATMSIAAGQCVDSTNVAMMTLAAFSKTTSAWALGSGNGGLDTGSIANSTWYHFYSIQRVDTQVVDVLISLSATAPTMPTNYTLKRRIGSGKTDGSGNWTSFTQDGDVFELNAFVADVSAVNPGTSAVTRTLGSVPTGVNVLAKLIVNIVNVGSGGSARSLMSDLSISDQAVNATISQTSDAANATGNVANANAELYVRTNTSAQIRSRLSFSDASVTLGIVTAGWMDRRGRDA